MFRGLWRDLQFSWECETRGMEIRGLASSCANDSAQQGNNAGGPKDGFDDSLDYKQGIISSTDI